MTRNDKAGTALQIYPNENDPRDLENEEEFEIAAEELAKRVHTTFDPTERHKVTYHHVDSRLIDKIIS
jgi:hypothetical protein